MPVFLKADSGIKTRGKEAVLSAPLDLRVTANPSYFRPQRLKYIRLELLFMGEMMNNIYDLQTDPNQEPHVPAEPTTPQPTPSPEPDPYPVTDPVPEPNPNPGPTTPEPFPTPPEPIPQYPPDVVF